MMRGLVVCLLLAVPLLAGAENLGARGRTVPVDRDAREQMKDLPEITEEAFRDLLKKYGRTADFREALKMSAKQAGKNQAGKKG